MGDFTGFSFGNWRSSDSNGLVKILRVSGGDRYTEDLQPEIKDRTAEVLGVDGEYYFGSSYGPKTIDIDIAFDSLTESQFRELRKVFGTKQIQELVFDELPYKKYLAKISSPIELSYVCFDEPIKSVGAARDGIRVADRTTTTSIEEIDGEEVEVTTTTITREQVTPYIYNRTQTQRVYKGEGKISFICYFPFAKSVFKTLPNENNDWAFSSGILSADDYNGVDVYDAETGIINVYNGGDLPTGFRLYLPAAALGNSTRIDYVSLNNTATLNLNAITLKTGDIGVLIDTNNSLVIGVFSIGNDVTDIVTTGNLYNQYVSSGSFFKLETNSSKSDNATITITNGAAGIKIYYDYLYF